ncbi:FIG00388203: hypothetical protein [hydrothermal vent metagenome]|uniref:PD-(D/E)XK endonuclease-like domain-containing protein n=1 Tax=hydrothermal vent metagenome TaxID=652676 RepID=A0A1W1EJY0_9ZZZZ
MKKLLIYPTARAIRDRLENHKTLTGFIPNLMRIDEFENRAILLENSSKIDTIKRIFYLRDSINLKEFDRLKFDMDLVKFYTKSDAIFKFFEELSLEGVSFDTLREADAYSEFSQHLDILEQLLLNYKNKLAKDNLIDKAFIPQNYRLNLGFIDEYNSFELYLEGYLSNFELELISKIAEIKPFIIHITTSKFNQKIQDRFRDIGIELENNSHITFEIKSKKIISSIPNKDRLNTKIFRVEERIEQIPLAFEAIENMVNSGISPDNIAILLPDESFKELLYTYDKVHNLNFAMGFEYSKSYNYKKLESIYSYLSSRDDKYKKLILKYDSKIDLEKIEAFNSTKKIKIDEFIEILKTLKLLDENEKVKDKIEYLKIIFTQTISTFKEWLFIYLKVISSITNDDIRGGKITVMGVLESRGISFDGVIILDFNDDIVPSISSKDRFLNSSVRAFASLPTKADREALQKHYYKRVLEKAKQSVIIYPTAQNRLLSRFAYELGLNRINSHSPDISLLYNISNEIPKDINPIIHFDASSFVWSATRLKSFINCKREFYYKYILKIGGKDNNAFSEGRFLHKLLEKLIDNDMSDIEMKLNYLLDELLGKSAMDTLNKIIYRDKILKFLDYHQLHFKNQGYEVVAKEQQIDGVIQGLRFKGVVDRLDKRDDELIVVDYKSGSTKNANRSKNLDKLDDFQMSIYYYLLKDKYPNISLIFLKILEDNPIEYIEKLEEKNKILLEYIEYLKEKKEITCEKCDDLMKCRYCDYRLICERGEYISSL